MTKLCILIYNLVLMVGTAYLVQCHEWSAWWFVFALYASYGFPNTIRGGKDEHKRERKNEP